MDEVDWKAGKLTLPHEPHDLVEPSMEEPHLGQVEWAFATGVVKDCILAVWVVVGLVVVCGLGRSAKVCC
jgi:hypothetical protein